MYRVCKLSGKVYGIKIDSVYSEAENIQDFVDNGDTVLLAIELSDIADIMGIDEEDIIIVD